MVVCKHQDLAEDESGEKHVSSLDFNEKICKVCRGHRDANNFDAEFISKVMKECQSMQNSDN